MSENILDRTMISIVNSGNGISPELLESIWDKAAKEKNNDLLVAIAGRDNLSLTLENKVKGRNEIIIKSTYLSRNGMNKEALAEFINEENRAGVLAEVYESLSEEKAKDLLPYYEIKFATKTTKAVAIALLKYPELLSEKSTVLLVKEICGKSLTDDQTRAYNKLLRRSIAKYDLLKEVITVLGDSEINQHAEDIVKNSNNDQSVIDSVFQTLVGRYLDTIKEFLKQNPDGTGSLRVVASLDRTFERVFDMKNPLMLKKLEDELSKIPAHFLQSNNTLLDIIDRANKSLNGDFEAENNVALNGTPSQLLELFDNMKRGKTLQDEKVILALILTREDVDQFTTQIANYYHLFDDENLVTILQSCEGKKIKYELYLSNLRLFIEHDKWVSLGGENLGKISLATFIRETYHEKTKENRRFGYYASGRGMAVEFFEAIDDIEALQELPFSFYTDELWHGYVNARSTKAANIVGKVLENYLNEGGTWETITIFANDFQGSLKELSKAALLV